MFYILAESASYANKKDAESAIFFKVKKPLFY